MLKCRRKICINDKDLKLIEYLYLNKIAKPNQINRDVLGVVSKTNVNRRLKRLFDNRLIEKHSIVVNSFPILAYSLSQQGFNKFILNSGKNSLVKQYKSNSILHDLNLVDIQNRFLSFKGVKSYYTENLLRSKSDLSRTIYSDILDGVNCDAVIEIITTLGSELVPVEYEINLKYAQRYNNLFLDYYLNQKIKAVFYIIQNEEILNKIEKIAKENGKNFSPKLYFTTFKKFMDANQNVIFSNINEKQIILKKI
ncbi:MAG: hypothetical protein HQK51_05605 [Oligoflexia bacterium]|nr:hypothetical protein [Oligoflexia bacterium]